MTRKTADDLDDDPAAIGGAMSKWPRRTVAWACRDARVNAAVPAAIGSLVDREADDLRELARKAERNGIDGEAIRARADVLEAAPAREIIAATDRAYQNEYGSDQAPEWSDGDGMCPFEESGLDKACWRCSVPGEVLDLLADSTDPSDPTRTIETNGEMYDDPSNGRM